MAKSEGMGSEITKSPSPERATDLISAAVAVAFTVPVTELRAPSRRPASIALARQSAMYLTHVMLGLTFTEVGRVFGRDRTTAAHACRRIEDRRTEARLDAALAELEQALRRDFVRKPEAVS